MSDQRKTEEKTVLITGAAGFIGTNLALRLLGEGCRVIGVDSFVSGARENIRMLSEYPKFSFFEHDVTEPLLPLFEGQTANTDAGTGGDISRIYHLACPASPVFYQADPVHTMKTSVLGALHVLELARACNARALLASTSEIYGEPLVHPQPETYRGNVNPDGIRACYDEGKRAAETLFFDYERMYGTDIRVIRIFNTYGPYLRADDGRVISSFIEQALSGKELTVYGDGSQTRSFCYISDLLDGMIRFMETECGEGEKGPLNLGNPEEISVREAAEQVLERTGSRGTIRYLPLPKDDPTRRCPDITKARALLPGWEPKVPFSEGLSRTIAWFRKQAEIHA